MRLFRYEASTFDGDELFGAIEALNARDAVGRLSQRGMRSIFIVAIDERSGRYSDAQEESLRLRARRPAVERTVSTDEVDADDDSVDGSIGAIVTPEDPPAQESEECHRALRGEVLADAGGGPWSRGIIVAMSIDKSIDRSIDVEPKVNDADPLDRTELRAVWGPTATGERALAFIESLTRNNVSFCDAVTALSAPGWPRRTKRLFAGLHRYIDSPGTAQDLLGSQRRVFGSVAMEFLRIGEQQTGTIPSLSAYLAFRREQRVAGAFRPRSLLSARTRRFAIALACAQEISGDVVQSLRCASMEMPRRLRRRLAQSILAVRSGEDLGASLPKSTLFRPGFEPHFIKMVDQGVHLSQLPATLRLLAHS